MNQMDRVARELPSDEIVVRNGRVVSLQEWCDWNGSHEIVLDARKEPDGDYTVFPFDPEHGGTSLQRGKTMAEAAGKAMHPDIAKKLGSLFDLLNPTERQIRQIHYRKGSGLKVIFQ
ncbi:MAG: hypothetical protein HYT47_02275 [Candidatus Vogelbacteria bacterium]|nr:hypothetical protein [Candidatus Vogelbacteria bacterium]